MPGIINCKGDPYRSNLSGTVLKNIIMGSTRIKTTNEIAIVLILSVILALMLFSFGLDLGREYYQLTHK